MMDISIALNAEEINEAITNYIANKGADVGNKKITILVVTGRKGKGARAEICISPEDKESTAETASVNEVQGELELETDADRQEVYDNSEIEQTETPAETTESLFDKATA